MGSVITEKGKKMSKYIEADWLLEEANMDGAYGYVGADQIAKAPTAHVVEVVRCKDCRWGREACGNIECFADTNVPPEYHGYEWFCPNGERREDAEVH